MRLSLPTPIISGKQTPLLITQAIQNILPSRPTLTVISGANATGKTTLTNSLAYALGINRCVTIEMDDYQFARLEKRERGITGQNPKGTKLDQARKDLIELLQERPISKPRYEFKTGQILSNEIVLPNQHILVNGTSAFADEIRTLADCAIFLEAPDSMLLERRLKRDTYERGYTEERIKQLFPELDQDYKRYIEPQKGEADFLVNLN